MKLAETKSLEELLLEFSPETEVVLVSEDEAPCDGSDGRGAWSRTNLRQGIVERQGRTPGKRGRNAEPQRSTAVTFVILALRATGLRLNHMIAWESL